jgi:hypothetical protein
MPLAPFFSLAATAAVLAFLAGARHVTLSESTSLARPTHLNSKRHPMKFFFDVRALGHALALPGLVTGSTFVNADSAAFDSVKKTAVIGAAAAAAGVVDSDGFTKVLSTQLRNSGTPKVVTEQFIRGLSS